MSINLRSYTVTTIIVIIILINSFILLCGTAKVIVCKKTLCNTHECKE